MNIKQVRLSSKITVLVSLLIMILLLLSGLVFYRSKTDSIISRIEDNCMNVAQIVSRDKFIIDNLGTKDPQGRIQPYVSAMLDNVSDVEYIVVVDMELIRYSHPIEERVGHTGVGEDTYRIKEGKPFVSRATGSLGDAIRAFSPVVSPDGKQIGFVVVGILLDDIDLIKEEAISSTFIISLLGLFLGIIGAYLLAYNIKKSIMGLEPYEIARMYIEKDGILNAVGEGIIAIDIEGRITMINSSAVEVLSLGENDKDYIGRKIEEVFPETRLLTVLDTGMPEFNSQEKIVNAVILVNRLPILEKGKLTGAIATFTDRTNFVKLAEEITGIKQITDGLRANNHEFSNKLHVILGLVHRKKYGELEDYIIKTTNYQKTISQTISEKISNSQVEAILIGKSSRASELGIELKLFKDSHLSQDSILYTNSLVTILGNLIENSFQAVMKNRDNPLKRVIVGIVENEGAFDIIVDDTGIGLREEEIEKIFDRGYSTKESSFGTGLYLVKKSVDALDGKIEVESEYMEGTSIHINIKKAVDYD